MHTTTSKDRPMQSSAFGSENRNSSASAADTAREVIKRLAREKLPPTPENFSSMYVEISGDKQSGAKRGADAGHEELAIRTALALVDRFPAAIRKKEALISAIRNGAWHAVDGLVDELNVSAPATAPALQSGSEAMSSTMKDWQETAKAALQCSAPLYLSTVELKRDASRQFINIRDVQDIKDVTPIAEELQTFAGKLSSFRNAELRNHLQLKSLMSAVVKNVTTLNAEQSWLAGQMARVDQAINSDADGDTLRNLEASLRDATRRQEDLKKHLDDAKSALREMLNSFIDRLGDMAQSTGEFSTRVDAYAVAIESAENVHDVTSVVKNLLSDTRGLHDQMNSAKDDLNIARSTAAQHESRVRELETELVKVSELVRTDHLTRALNRRGLDSAYESEAARAHRNGTTLCLAVIDIDNFKSLNDKHGHHAGDDALRHLSKVIRDAVRPTDILARIGGEEFVVLLPETALDVAVKVTERLQRQLTREFFLHGAEKLFITFSAGVTEVKGAEAQQAVIDRADKALYQAKHTGKNRVIAV
jgi:diguanylate cyclase